MHYDVIILGAGAAGLSASDYLTKQGLKVLVLEAQDRIGGRVHTMRHEYLTTPIELGAEFIHGDAPNLNRIVKDAALPTVNIDGPRLEWNKEAGLIESHFFEKVAPLIDKLGECKEDITFDEFLLKHAEYPEEVRKHARSFIQGYNTAPTSEVSAYALSGEYVDDGNDSYSNSRVSNGYDTVVYALAERSKRQGATILQNHLAEKIIWEKGKVAVEGKNKESYFSYSANKAIITVPVPLIAAEAFSFIPAVPEKILAAKNIGMGKVIKTIVIFKNDWWEKHTAFINGQFLHVPDEKIPTWWALSPSSTPVLVGWTGGPKVEALGDDPMEIKKIAVDILSKIFPSEQNSLNDQIVDMVIVNWQKDTFTRGSYTYEKAGFTDAKQTLARPIAETLFFAGEGTLGGGETGTVEGAIISGLRAAKELFDA